MEKVSCKVICGAPANLAVKGLMMITMMIMMMMLMSFPSPPPVYLILGSGVLILQKQLLG